MHFLTSWDCCRHGGDDSVDGGSVEHGNGSGDNSNDGNVIDGDGNNGNVSEDNVSGGHVNGINVDSGVGGSVKDGGRNARNKPMPRRNRDRLTLNLLRSVCHVFYFECNQVLLCPGKSYGFREL